MHIVLSRTLIVPSYIVNHQCIRKLQPGLDHVYTDFQSCTLNASCDIDFEGIKQDHCRLSNQGHNLCQIVLQFINASGSFSSDMNCYGKKERLAEGPTDERTDEVHPYTPPPFVSRWGGG